MINKADYEGSTPLHVAASLKKADVIKHLLKPHVSVNKNASVLPAEVICHVNAVDRDGRTPLHVACETGDLDTVQSLLDEERGLETMDASSIFNQTVNINSFAKTGRTPLHEAVWNGGYELVALLLQHRADVNALGSPTVDAKDVIKKAAEAGEDASRCVRFQASRAGFRISNGSSNVSVNSFCPVPDDQVHLRGRPRSSTICNASSPAFHFSKSIHDGPGSYTEGMPISSSHSVFMSSGNRSKQYLFTKSVSIAATQFNEANSEVTPLVEACIRGDIQIVDCLLKEGATDERGLALCVSLFQGYDLISKHLLLRCNGLRSSMVQEKDADSQVNALAISWHGLSLVQIDTEWLSETYLMCSEDDYQPYSISDTIENAVAPAVTHYFSPSIKTLRSSSCQPITWLSLKSNKLLNIPIEVFRLENLIYLDVSGNLLTELPTDGVSDANLQGWTCHTLTYLNASANALLSVPQCLWKLSEVVEIKLARNSLASLDIEDELLTNEELVTLKVNYKLKTLNVNRNCLQALPSSLFAYPLLTEITATNNEIESLPSNMWTAPSLQSLHLSHNHLSSLPVESLPKGVRDSILYHRSPTGGNTLDNVTGAGHEASCSLLRQCSWVKVTYYSNGKMAALPLADDNYMSKNCGIAYVASSLQVGMNATELDSYWAISEDVEQEIFEDKQSGLKTLKLADNRFYNVPSGLPCLAPNLTHLNLSHNPIVKMGSLCQYPAHLETLNLSHTELVSTEVESCSHYHICYVAEMGHESVDHGHRCSHQSHEILCTLKRLNLMGNFLTSVCLQLSKSPYMMQTQRINFRADGNTGDEVEVQRLQLLYPLLLRLDLRNNRLKFLPAAIGYQEQLQYLHLEGNPELTELPLELGRLKRKLWSLKLDADQMHIPSPGIAKGSALEILTYLYSLKQE